MAFARNPAYNYSDLMRRIAKRLGHADAIVRHPSPPPVASPRAGHVGCNAAFPRPCRAVPCRLVRAQRIEYVDATLSVALRATGLCAALRVDSCAARIVLFSGMCRATCKISNPTYTMHRATAQLATARQRSTAVLVHRAGRAQDARALPPAHARDLPRVHALHAEVSDAQGRCFAAAAAFVPPERRVAASLHRTHLAAPRVCASSEPAWMGGVRPPVSAAVYNWCPRRFIIVRGGL